MEQVNIRDAILVIVEAMEDEASAWEDSPQAARLFRSYAKQLRTVLAVSTPSPDPPEEENTALEMMRAKATRDVEKGRTLYTHEDRGATMTLLVGGKLDGDYFPIDPTMPIGARTRVGATQVYQLRADRKLHFDYDESTKK